MYYVLTELTNTSFNLTFRQLVRADGDKTKVGTRRLLSRGPRVYKSATAAVATLMTCSRLFKVVQIKIYGYETKALLASEAVPNLVSEKLLDKLNQELDRHPAGLTLDDGQRARSVGICREAPVCSSHLHLTMDFYVMDSPLSDVTVVVPAFEALQGCLVIWLHQFTLVLGSMKSTVLFKFAVIEVPVDDSSKTDNEDLTSSCDAAPNVDESFRDSGVAVLNEDLHPRNDDYSAPSFSGSSQKVPLLKKKLSHLDDYSEKTSNIVAWSLRDLRSAHVAINHYLELKDSRRIYHRPRRMAPKHNAFMGMELDSLLDAGIIVLMSAYWSFPVVIASEKDGKFSFC